MILQNKELKKICDELSSLADSLPILQDTFSNITELYNENGYNQDFFNIKNFI